MTPFAWRPVGMVVVAQMVVLSALSGRYGYHRDELYFLAAGRRLAWGYVDQPPLTPFLARVFAFGDSPATLRIAATVMGAGIVVVAALLAREFAGGIGAQVLSSAAVALSTFGLAVTHMLSTATADLLLWTVVTLCFVKVLRGQRRWWLGFGVAVGVALTNKWLVPLLVVALLVGVLAVGPRSVLRSWWLLAGAAATLAIAAPVVVWQAVNGFPLVTVARGISDADGAENRVLFIPLQILYLSPVLVPVCAIGWLMLWRDVRFRSIAVAYPVLCVVTVVLGGKPYYPMALLVVLLAAGAQPVWQWAVRHRRWTSVLAVGGAVASVVSALPVLPVRALGPVLALNPEQGEQVGWREFTETVAEVYRETGSDAVVFTRNYGQAGAVEQFGSELGLPQPYSGHMSYWDWGPPAASDAPVIVVGNRPPVFTGCEVRAVHRSVVENEEDGTAVAICDPVDWATAWPLLRRYYG